MLRKKELLTFLLVFVLTMTSTLGFAQGVPEEQALQEEEVMEALNPISIPKRFASPWALNELVDSDRYGIYDKAIYENNLRDLMSDSNLQSLLKNFEKKLAESGLEKVDKPNHMAKVGDSKTRGGFLREVYNRLVPYEKTENLGKDPIMYLSHKGIVLGDKKKDLALNRNITTEEGIIFIKRAVDYIFNENNLASKGLMWKVENKGNTVYLLGSIHYGVPNMYPLSKTVMDRFSNSSNLYVEIDISDSEKMMEETLKRIIELGEKTEKESKYQDGTTLKSVIGEELYSNIKKIMDKNEVEEKDYVNLKPYGVINLLQEIHINETFDENMEDLDNTNENLEDNMDSDLMKLLTEGPEYGLDLYFLDKAKTLNKEIGELETIDSQLSLLFGENGMGEDPLSKLSTEEQIEELKNVLKENFDSEGKPVVNTNDLEDMPEISEDELNAELKKQFELINQMFDAIKEGNSKKLSEIFLASGGDTMLGGQLIGDRDKAMAKKISGLLESDGEKTYFVVVGAAHYVVDGTIIDNLKSMGYEIKSLNQ